MALEQLTDPRKRRGVRYRLVQLLQLERDSLPHETPYERVLDRMDREEVERVIGQFLLNQARPIAA